MLLAIGMLANSCTTTPSHKDTVIVSFDSAIKPLFESRCLTCHNGQPAAGRLDLRNRASVFQKHGGEALIIPGNAEKSKVLRVISLRDEDPGAMPPTGHALASDEIALIKTWIAQGAPWPNDERGHLKPRKSEQYRSH